MAAHPAGSSSHRAQVQSQLISSYKTEVLPGIKTSIGANVTFSSTVELVPEQHGQAVNVMKTQTIWDNDDSSTELKSTSKSLTEGTTGEVLNGQFTMTFPEDLPKRTHPITTAITINGEQVHSDKTYVDIASLQQAVNGELLAYWNLFNPKWECEDPAGQSKNPGSATFPYRHSRRVPRLRQPLPQG